MNYGHLYDQQVADTYDVDALGLLSGARNLAIAQISATDLPADAALLDLGVGTGETLRALAPRFPRARAIGIDLSARMIDVARRKLDFEAHVDDACNAGEHVKDGTVDLVLAHFLTTFVDRARLFHVASAALRPGGLFSVVSSPSEAFRATREKIGYLFADEAALRAASPSPETAEVLADELRAAGFEIVALERFRRRIVFETFAEGLDFGLKSGFFAHAIAGLGLDGAQIAAVADVPGLFPLEDEYHAVAILARPAAKAAA
jgi:SAM-dependent methyltransferase